MDAYATGSSLRSRAGVRTLDLEHVREVERLRGQRRHGHELRERLRGVASRLQALERQDPAGLSDAEFDELKLCAEEQHVLQQQLLDVSDTADDVDYLMRAGPFLFRYYDIFEKDRRVSGLPGQAIPTTCGPCNDVAAVACEVASSRQPPPKSILQYFSKKPCASPTAADSNGTQCAMTSCHPAAEQPPVAAARGKPAKTIACTDDRATLLERYLGSLDCRCPRRYIMQSFDSHGAADCHMAPHAQCAGGRDQHGNDGCRHCGSSQPRTLMLQDGYVYCPKCFTVEYILVDHDKPSYKDPPKEVAYFAYKRINHFNEWLNQVQGKETTDIPDEVYDSILLEVKKQKIANMACLTRKRVKEILKKLRINKYYEHVPHIINRLNGIPSPHLPPELEERLRHMFCQIQVPFLKHAPPTRKNFLSYSYCLNKMMQLLEKDQYLECFSLLKSRDKLYQQDLIWEKICNELGWDFIPSL